METDNQTPTAPAVGSKDLLGGFVVAKEKYPNGEEYLNVTHGTAHIGSCDMEAGGFLVWGKRKPVPTIRDAVLQMLGDHLNRCAKQEFEWRKKLSHFKNTNPPNGDLTNAKP